MFKHVKTDPELCIGCKTCMAACVASHTGKALFALKPILSFDLSPQVDRDFDPVLTFFACHPSSSMRDDPRVARYFPDCVMALRKHILREEWRGIPVKKTELTWEEEKRVLRELFGLETEGM